MVSDWNGKAEPFKIHKEGWALIVFCAVLVFAAALLILG